MNRLLVLMVAGLVLTAAGCQDKPKPETTPTTTTTGGTATPPDVPVQIASEEPVAVERELKPTDQMKGR